MIKEIGKWQIDIPQKTLNTIKKLEKEEILVPRYEQIFRALELTDRDQVKVVLLGQDPYPKKGDADGLAFSFSNLTKNNYLPKSLINLYKELESDLGIRKTGGDLSSWAEQGVLLLNTTLTTTVGNSNIHVELWDMVTTKLIRDLANEKQNIVFLLLGKNAKSKVKDLDLSQHCVLTYPHPSPLSAYRGFFGSKIYSQTNEYLIKNGIEPIKWN